MATDPVSDMGRTVRPPQAPSLARGHSQATASPVSEVGRTVRPLQAPSLTRGAQSGGSLSMARSPPFSPRRLLPTPHSACLPPPRQRHVQVETRSSAEATPCPSPLGQERGGAPPLPGWTVPGCPPPRGQSRGREQSRCPPGLRQPQASGGAPRRGDVRWAPLALQHLPQGAGHAEPDPEASLRPGGTQDPPKHSPAWTTRVLARNSVLHRVLLRL